MYSADKNLNKSENLSANETTPFKLSIEQINEAKSLGSDPEFIQDVRESNFFSNLAQKFKVLGQVAALASLFAAFGPASAQANEIKSAKVEHMEINFDRLKEVYKVPDELRKLAEFEDPTSGYVQICDGIVFLAEHQNNMLSEEKANFLKNVVKIPTPDKIVKINSGEGRWYELSEYNKYLNSVGSIYGEVSSRINNGVTITDVDDNNLKY